MILVYLNPIFMKNKLKKAIKRTSRWARANLGMQSAKPVVVDVSGASDVKGARGARDDSESGAVSQEVQECPISMLEVHDGCCYVVVRGEAKVRYSPKALSRWVTTNSSASPLTRKVIRPRDVIFHDVGQIEVPLIASMLECIDNKHEDELCAYIQKSEFHIDTPFSMSADSPAQTTLLGYAAYKGVVEMVQVLIREGASIDCSWCVEPPVGRRAWLTGVRNVFLSDFVKVIRDEDDENEEADRVRKQYMGVLSMCVSGIGGCTGLPRERMEVLLFLLRNGCDVYYAEIEKILEMKDPHHALHLIRSMYSYTHVNPLSRYRDKRLFDCVLDRVEESPNDLDTMAGYADIAHFAIDQSRAKIENITIRSTYILHNMMLAMQFRSWESVVQRLCDMGATMNIETLRIVVRDETYSDELVHVLLNACIPYDIKRDTSMIKSAAYAGRSGSVVQSLLLRNATIDLDDKVYAFDLTNF